MSNEITILGAGGFGLALAATLDSAGHKVTVWSEFENEINEIRKTGYNQSKLPGVRIASSIELTNDISCVKGKDVVIFGIPVSFVRSVAKKASPFIDEKTIVVNTGKGFEEETLKRMSEVLSEEIPQSRICVLSGPSHAEEVAIGMPTTVVAASDSKECAEYIQSVISNEKLRIYVSDDVIGCEVGGALKNIIALCAGIVDGLGYGDNTKAALMTRGMNEITRLGMAMGAKPETFFGLTGIGDLIVTCTSMHSRNRRAGILIGQGIAPEEAVKLVGTVEGYFCTKAAYKLAQKYGVNMPITEKCHDVIVNGLRIGSVVGDLMNRPRRDEVIV